MKLTMALVMAMALGLVHARAQAEDFEADEADAATQLTSGTYNIWICAAVKRIPFGGSGPIRFGSSNPFPAGSGQGQAAQAAARSQALSACGLGCQVECFVKQFAL
jgi:hypothetical protein